MKHLKQFFFLFLVMMFSNVKAQKSIMEEVSYSYLDTLVRVARENYPRIKALDQEIFIAQSNVQKAQLSWFDLLGVYYFYNPKRSTQDPTSSFFLNGLQLGVSFNLGTFVQKPATVKASKGQLQVARLQKDEYYLNLEANVKDRYFRYIQKLTLVKLRTQAMQDAQSTLESIRTKFERGQETFENYSRILALINEQNREKVIAESDMLSAKAFLEELLNKKLEEIK